MPLLLADNGGAFAKISAFEVDFNREIETELSFVILCDSVRNRVTEKYADVFALLSCREKLRALRLKAHHV